MKDQPPKTIFNQQIHVSSADRQSAQEEYNIAITLERAGKITAAQKHKDKANRLLGRGLIQGVAHAENAEVAIAKGQTATGEEYVTAVAKANNDSKLPGQFRKDHRKAIAMTGRGPVSKEMLDTASKLFADNAIKVVKVIGRSVGKVINITWDLTRKGIETKRAAQEFRKRQQALIDHEAEKLAKNGRNLESLPKKVREVAKQTSDLEHERFLMRQEEIAESRVVTVTKYRGGKEITEVTHEEDPHWG